MNQTIVIEQTFDLNCHSTLVCVGQQHCLPSFGNLSLIDQSAKYICQINIINI